MIVPKGFVLDTLVPSFYRNCNHNIFIDTRSPDHEIYFYYLREWFTFEKDEYSKVVIMLESL